MRDKKVLYKMAIILGIIIVIIMIIAIISSIGGKRLSYKKLESKLKSSAIKYYEANSEELPRTEGGIVTLTSETMTAHGFMKDISKIEPKGANCSGSVNVVKNGEEYLYFPILKCGEKYSTKTLSDAILINENIVASGSGLYKDSNGYIFKGDNINNFVRLDNKRWAIMSIDNDGYVKLIATESHQKGSSTWDDRYNVDDKSYTGINNYSLSRIKETLLGYEKDETILSNDLKALVARKKWCIGKRSKSNISINNNEECNELSSEQMFGLPSISDMYSASIDPNCNTINDLSCGNYNYLSSYGISSWTFTGISETTSRVYYLASTSVVEQKASAIKTVTPVIYLSKFAMYSSGDGSFESPYLLDI